MVRGGYGIFYETENTDGRVNNNIVPFRLNETAFNDRGVVPNRTMADFFLGLPLGSFTTNPSINPTTPNCGWVTISTGTSACSVKSPTTR